MQNGGDDSSVNERFLRAYYFFLLYFSFTSFASLR